jgi:phage gp45-like
MHRATPLNSSFRAFTGGGTRGIVHEADDTKLLQEMKANFMVNETREAIESPQNYGFTSVVFDAEKDMMGKVQAAAEHFTSFLGGNRTLPVSIMDDRRHRLYKLDKGDTAMFRGRGDKQQFHLTQDGGFWTAPQDKTVRMSLIPENSESNSTQQSAGAGGAGGGTGGPSVTAADAGTGGGAATGTGQQQGQQKKGQEAVYKKAKDSKVFVDMTKDATRASGKEVHIMLDDGKIYAHVIGQEVYLGGKKGEGTFAKVSTVSGPSINVYAKVG